MIKSIFCRLYNFIILLSFLPLIYGCKGGEEGGSASAGIGSIGSTSITSFPESGTVEGTITQLHTPEPATVFLLGTGILALHLYKKRMK